MPDMDQLMRHDVFHEIRKVFAKQNKIQVDPVQLDISLTGIAPAKRVRNPRHQDLMPGTKLLQHQHRSRFTLKHAS